MVAPRSSVQEGAHGGRGAALAVFLLALGTAWSAGNVGSVVGEIGDDFDISLATVGLLSGSLLLGFSALGSVVAPLISERLGIVRSMILACLLTAAGNVVFAVTPAFAGLAAGRVLAGFGLGVAVVAGPVFARATGGVARVALFGAAIQLGIAGGLAVGAGLNDLDVDWRLTFWLSALVGLSALPLLLGRESIAYSRASGAGFVRLAVRSARVWRLGALFVSIFAVPLILSSWLVHYLSVDNGLAAGTAGALGFLLFGVSAAAREVGGRLAVRGFSPFVLGSGAAWLAALGLVLLAADDSVALVLVAVVAAGVGFALPYGPSIIQAQRLFPREPTEPVALMSLIGTLIPVPLVPLIGSLLDAGDGTEVFLALGAFVMLAGVLNLRPVTGSLEPPAPAPDPARGSP